MTKENRNLPTVDGKEIKVDKLGSFSKKEKTVLVKILGEEQTNQIELEKLEFYKNQDFCDINQKTLEQKEKEKALSKVSSENIIDASFFIEQYKKEEKTSRLLNQKYYSNNDGGFNLKTGLNNFYIQGDIVFANSTWKSKIFKVDGDKLVDLDRNYREIKKVGDYYIGINVETKDKGNSQEKIDGSETYVLLDNKGNKIQKLNGNLIFDNQQGIYIEYETSEEVSVKNIYDKNFDIIVENIPEQVSLLGYKDGQYLTFDNQNNKYFILQKGSIWEDKINDIKIINQSSVFLQYQSNKAKIKQKNEKEVEMPLNFDMEFDGDTHFIKSIKKKSGEVVFEAEQGVKYKINKPDNLYGSNFNSSGNRKAINKGLFILSKIDDNKKVADKFINASGDDPIILDFTGYAGYTFLEGNVIKHFINNHESELYNAKTGEKLGKSDKYLDNGYSFQCVTLDNGKYKLVENKTGIVKQQDFDELLKIYNRQNRKIVILKNDGEISAIEIQN